MILWCYLDITIDSKHYVIMEEMMSKIKDELLNKTFKNKIGLEFLVVSYEYYRNTEMYFKIRFIKSLNEKIVDHRAIQKGSIKDELNPNKYGVGYMGKDVSSKVFNGIAYKRWDAMLSRCYNIKNVQYKNYGGRGVSVCQRWHCFKNFIEDIQHLQGWNEEDFLNRKLHLDKDKLVEGNKIYSPNTCCWLTQTENTAISNRKKQTKFMAKNLKNETTIIEVSARKFAKEHNLSERTVLRRIRDDNEKPYNNWIFKCLE